MTDKEYSEGYFHLIFNLYKECQAKKIMDEIKGKIGNNNLLMFDLMMEIVKENYSYVDCDIHMDDKMTDGVYEYGTTLYPDEEDEFDRIKVEINKSLNVALIPIVLAHELAHVIAGREADHNSEWRINFEDIKKTFNMKFFEKTNLLK